MLDVHGVTKDKATTELIRATAVIRKRTIVSSGLGPPGTSGLSVLSGHKPRRSSSRADFDDIFFSFSQWLNYPFILSS